MAYSTSTSRPPTLSHSWAAFFAPVGVSALVIVSVSAVVLMIEPEPIDRLPVRQRMDLDASVPAALTHQRDVDSMDAGRPPPRDEAEPRRSRGFSPVLRDAGPDAPPEEVSEAADEGADEEANGDAPLTPERRRELRENVISSTARVPFLRGMSATLRKVADKADARRAGLLEEGQSNDSEVSEGAEGGDPGPLEPPLEQEPGSVPALVPPGAAGAPNR